MPAPYTTLRSKLNRAICAYLVSVGAGSVKDTQPSFTQSSLAFPNTTVRATTGTPDPPFTGNYRIQVWISIKGSASQSTTEPNPDLRRAEFDTRIATVADALMSGVGNNSLSVSDNINAAGRALATAADPTDPASVQLAANNADMVDFTLMQWIDKGFGDGQADMEDCTWEEILIFEAYCCSSNVS